MTSSSSSIADSDTHSAGRNSTFPSSRMEVKVRFNGRESRRRLPVHDSVDDDVTSRRDVTKKDMSMEDFKVEIVRQLIEDFDLEKTVERYRNLSTVEYKIQPKDFSLDSTLHANRVNGQIRDLMGSDVILLLNKNYREELDKKLAKQQEAKVKQEEKRRAEKESQRLRRLFTDGVITAEEFQREMGLQRDHCLINTRGLPSAKHREDKHKVSPHATCPSSIRQRNVHTRSLSSKTPKEHRSTLDSRGTRITVKSAPAYHKRTRPLSHHVRSRPRSEVKVTSVTSPYVGHRPLLHRASSFMTESQMSIIYGQDLCDGDSVKDDFSDKDSELDWSPIRTESTFRNSRGKKRERPKHALLDVLYKEETVDGLYKVAERIVRPGTEETKSTIEVSPRKPATTYYLAPT